MTNFEVGDNVMSADKKGETMTIEDHPIGGQLLHVYTTKVQVRQLLRGIPYIEGTDSILDRIIARQINSPISEL